MNAAAPDLPSYQFRVVHLLAVTCLVACVLRFATIRAGAGFGAVHVCLAAAILYLAKWKIMRSRPSLLVAVGAYAVVVALLLPYVWIRIIYPLSHSPWLASPLLVYPLPTMSFVVFDLRIPGQTARAYWSRTCLELLLLTVMVVAWWHYWANHGGIIAPGLPW